MSPRKGRKFFPKLSHSLKIEARTSAVSAQICSYLIDKSILLFQYYLNWGKGDPTDKMPSRRFRLEGESA